MPNIGAIVKKREKFRSETLPAKSQIALEAEKLNSRILRILSAMVSYSHMRQEDIELEMGVCKTYLSKLFGGSINIKCEHVIVICKILEFPVSLFWRIVHEDELLPERVEEFDNAMVRRLLTLLVHVYSEYPDNTLKELNVQPVRCDIPTANTSQMFNGRRD